MEKKENLFTVHVYVNFGNCWEPFVQISWFYTQEKSQIQHMKNYSIIVDFDRRKK